MPWPQEEVDDSSITQTYENTPWSSLNVSIAGEDIDEIGYSKDQTSLGVMVEQPQNNRWDQRCMTNMVRANADIIRYNRETTKDRPRDAKFDNEDQATGIQLSLQHDNAISLVEHTASGEMRGEHHGLDNGQQRG